ncbi:MAG: UDP-N-acetylmuramate--L-alanine ligase [Planctomycetota bacterium]|jgi:UDP-N-acetylmuramate--alanine ligase
MTGVSGTKYHFIGIGGIGTSGLAKILIRNGATVSGSDMDDSAVVEHLRELGATIAIGHSPENISADTDIVVMSAAITAANPELGRASELGLPIHKYAEMLGRLFDTYTGIAVAGTHGKSTTSAWLSYVLEQAGAKPNYIVGAHIPQLGGSSGVGNGRVFVAEACEYDRSFLNLHPSAAVLLNIEQDHLDYYRDEDDIIDAFAEFAGGIKDGGVLIANGQDKNVARVLRRFKTEPKIVLYGLEAHCDVRAENLKLVNGTYEFDLYVKNDLLGRSHMALPGEFNVLNALAVTVGCLHAGLDGKSILEHLGGFTGIDRRLMFKAKVDGITILDDYAHHPTEIRASLKAIRQKYAPKRIWCVFQPHQYSRTRFLLDDFAESFKLADNTIVPEIYFVRDTAESKSTVNAEMLAERIRQQGCQALFINDFSGILEHLKNNVKDGDLVVTMGAGTIWKVADEYIQWFREHR